MQLHYTLYTLMAALPYVTTTEAVTCQSYCYSALDLTEGSGNYNALGECISISPAPLFVLHRTLKLILKCN